MKRAFAQRQIPTLLGILVLVGALVAGTALIGTGGGVFAPRATPQTTPKNLKITNIKDTSFTVSFLTDEATAGFVKYGKSSTDMKSQASDDRDQLAGNVSQFSTHYITVRDLDPETQYFFVAGTTSVPQFDNNGSPFTVTTAKRGGNPTAAKTAYGTVNGPTGSPADGAIIYMNITGVSELSALVKASGSWAIPLSNARTTDLSGYAALQQTDPVSLFVQGTKLSETVNSQTTVAETQPVPTLTIVSGGGGSSSTDSNLQADTTMASADETTADSTSLTTLADSQLTSSPAAETTVTASPSPVVVASPSPVASPVPSASPTTQTADTVDTTMAEKQSVETTKPTFTGKAPPNTTISIEIHSDTQLTTQVTTDANGNFVLPLSSGQTALEPGEHTITMKYIDPTTGQEQTVVRTFYVEAPPMGGGEGNGTSSTLLALASTSPSPSPFGTENPFTIPTPSPTPSPTASSSASPTIVMPSTSSAIPKSGSTGMTVALIVSGIFMIGVGIVSYRHNVAQALIDSEEETA